METVALEVQSRQKNENVVRMRQQSEIPCIIYGNVDNQLLKCKEQELHRAYTRAGESTVVELNLEGKNIPALFHTIDLDPITDRFAHVDFYAIDMKKEVTTHVPIHVEGEAPAVKNLGGILLTIVNEVTVTCLPKDLPHSFTVHIGKLENFGDAVTVADLVVPAGVTVKEEPVTTLVMVQEPRAEEVEPTPTAAEGEAAVEGEVKEGEVAAAKEGDAKAQPEAKAGGAAEKGKKE